MDLHTETLDQLKSLLPEAPKQSRFERLLDKTFGVNTSLKSNQGNKALAVHAISRSECLRGLSGIELQTDEQRRLCGGFANMAPIYQGGDPASATTCIDIFEFPNRACELPVVWIAPTHAEAVCKAMGKRLCTQAEWELACAGDPQGGPDWKYAYGNELDLNVCHTNRAVAQNAKSICDPTSTRSAWKTCSTMSEPSGAFPRCRSRFGVFDLHGNVAEIMTRREADGTRVSQLKGSAWFYVDVAQRPGRNARSTYPDHCRHDPRWHVERMSKAGHVNYHLGFRCCLSLDKKKLK